MLSKQFDKSNDNTLTAGQQDEFCNMCENVDRECEKESMLHQTIHLTFMKCCQPTNTCCSTVRQVLMMFQRPVFLK